MSDIHNLNRFIEAQRSAYESALEELRAGSKYGHWMWFIFPQVAGLGNSAISRKYAILSLDEARAYNEHSALGARLRECTEAMLSVEARTAEQVLGHIDSLKFRSCMTLFERATDDGLFRKALDRYFNGERDPLTIEILNSGF